MLIFYLLAMLCSSAQNFDLLCSLCAMHKLKAKGKARANAWLAIYVHILVKHAHVIIVILCCYTLICSTFPIMYS